MVVLDSSERAVVQQTVWTFDWIPFFVLSRLTHALPVSIACSSKVSVSFDWSANISCHKHFGKTRTKFYCRKYFTKMFIGTDKISEIVNDLDSDGSTFSEISDSDTCTVEYILTTINKKILFNNHTNEHVMQVISAGLLKFAWNYSHRTRIVCSNVSG
jgi:hypothetical protein